MRLKDKKKKRGPKIAIVNKRLIFGANWGTLKLISESNIAESVLPDDKMLKKKNVLFISILFRL